MAVLDRRLGWRSHLDLGRRNVGRRRLDHHRLRRWRRRWRWRCFRNDPCLDGRMYGRRLLRPCECQGVDHQTDGQKGHDNGDDIIGRLALLGGIAFHSKTFLPFSHAVWSGVFLRQGSPASMTGSFTWTGPCPHMGREKDPLPVFTVWVWCQPEPHGKKMFRETASKPARDGSRIGSFTNGPSCPCDASSVMRLFRMSFCG